MGREGGGGYWTTSSQGPKDLILLSASLLAYYRPDCAITSSVNPAPTKKKRNNFSSLFCLWLG